MRERLIFCAAVAVALWACQKDPERPDLAPDCDPAVMDCTRPPGQIGGSASGGGSSTDGDAGTAGETTLTARVTIYNEDRFDSRVTTIYDRPAVVEGDGLTGRVRAEWEGTGQIELGPLARRTVNWVAVLPELAGDDAMLTLHPIDTTVQRSGQLLLPLLRPSVLDLIFDVVTTPIAPLPGRGHAVLFIKDARTLEPVSGVRVTQPESELVAYAAAGTWSDVDTGATDETGLVLLGNIQAEPYPTGSLRQITLAGAVSGTVELKVVRDGTVVTDVLTTP